MTQDEKNLVAAAKHGSRPAFDTLAVDAIPKMRAVVWRLVGHPEECDDVVQAAGLKAWAGIKGFDGNSLFSTWAVAIAARAAVDWLRGQRRWRRESQIAFANLCAGSEAMQGEVMAPMMEPEFAFDVKEHVAYCFVCIGRSLAPEEQAALVLRDVMEFSGREAAEALGLTDSVLRHHLSAARQNMEERYQGLCALVSKTGICHQCEGLAAAAEAVGSGATALPDIANLADRLTIVRDVDPGKRESKKLHDIFFRHCKRIEDAGIGGITPEQCD
jgi:RNA polymerase sigma-70 factor (ECF subfamily)